VITRDFADFAVSQRKVDLDETVYGAASRAVMDWFGATLAGAHMQPAHILDVALEFARGAGRAQLVGRTDTVDPRSAALINGTASHTAELDDIFRDGVYHPGSPTVAAALAAGQHLNVTGERFLRAVAVGYEVGDRVAAAVQPAHYTYWHTTGTVGAIGAAAAVAEILQLDEETFAHALATATTMAAGLQQAFRSDAMSKPLHAGHAADAGLVAGFAAGRGFTGALDILEGAAGFGAAMSSEPDWNGAIARLGAPWGITQATVKNHSCCGHTFAAVDAALELRAQQLDPNLVDSVEVRTYATATKVAGNPDPRTEFEAKFSIAYCVAAALWLGSVRLAAFSEESLHHPGIRRLLPRTTIIADPELDQDFPARRRAHVTLRMVDGSTHTRHRDTRKGDPDDPLTDSEMQTKFDELAGPVLGAKGAQRLAMQLWDLRHRDSIVGLGAT
jgi:2-methylcitrate dehydratase PrpD